MKDFKFLFLIIILSMVASCDSENCQCECEGDIQVINNTGKDVIFHVIESSSSKEILWDWLVENDRITYTGIAEGEYRFEWEIEPPVTPKSKIIKINDCEATTETITN